MGALEHDTAVEGGDGRYRAELSSDWEIWGPMGGYVASVALRAAGAHSAFGRPAGLVGHFLGVAEFGAVELTTVTLRRARTAESVRVSLHQSERTIFEALVWVVDDDLPALTHDFSTFPDVAGRPLDHPTMGERLAEESRPARALFPFWENFEQRPTGWVTDWEHRSPEAPIWTEWLRFDPDPDTSDVWVDACRLLIIVDVGSWPSVVRHHVDPGGIYAPSIDLACHFHRLRPDARYLLARGESESGSDGLITTHQRVWAEDGAFLASGTSQLLCRPVR